MEKRMIWPPKVILQTPLGIMRDGTGNWLPRDIGKSSQFSNGHVVVQFGDTFDHDPNGNFLGVRDNTCAIIPDNNNPTLSKYKLDSKDEVPVFVHQRPKEFAIPTKFWSFSGIIEVEGDQTRKCHHEKGIIHGYTWFKITRMTGMDETYLRMGVAKVEYDSRSRQIRAIKPTPGIENVGLAQSHESLSNVELKSATLPSFGSITALRVDDFIYLYGQILDADKDVVLARIRISCPTPYTYWTGTGWSAFPADCRPIMSHIEHGQIFHTTIFGANSLYKYMFVGCSSFGDSKILMARAKSPEGPWDDGWVLNDADLYNSDPNKPPTGPFFYCIYPHPWALGFDGVESDGMSKTGDFMISWSEGGLVGGVLAASFRFNMEVKRIADPDDEPVKRGGDVKWSCGPN
ncbi:uncharacterized protein LY89DRAFT_728864 [Mollisia scopiformis]|uniref:DUF4185 domain-containing protein n=1 Tax=Mollisia scopiformis TaxID=149040 RepID=A0A194XRG9_MOLSC|nr:uncharacterized protein LY89DRAFT_728864 [Mollisia scopiformis]KUJ22746.1 hypothetical protein LY89DRAFT_728864 [Mollisia scopiformis]